MSEDELFTTKLQKDIASLIIQFPDLTDNEIAKQVVKKDGSHTSRSYVAKIRKKMQIAPTRAEAETPEITIEAAETVEGDDEEDKELLQKEEDEDEDDVYLPEKEEVSVEVDKLRPIFQRSIKRLGDTVIKRFADAKEGKISVQEAEDTEIVVFALIAKYGHVALEAYYLELTALLHFGSLTIRTIAQRRETQPEITPETPAHTQNPEETPPETQTRRRKTDPTNVPKFMDKL